MKKVCSVCLCLLLALVCCLPAFAAGTVSVQVDTALAEDGTLTVTLSVPEGSGLATFESTLNYDAQKLEFVGIAYGAGDMTTQNTATAGKVGLFMIWQETQTDAATLATVTFKVKDGATGTTDITFTDTAATDANDSEMAVSFGENNSVTVTLTEAPPTDEAIPSTAGTYVAVGVGCVVAVAAAVTAGALIKRKKDTE
ncbi:MAG: cohesin domain-containing protein [Candidatus Fimenecus sp.]